MRQRAVGTQIPMVSRNASPDKIANEFLADVQPSVPDVLIPQIAVIKNTWSTAELQYLGSTWNKVRDCFVSVRIIAAVQCQHHELIRDVCDFASEPATQVLPDLLSLPAALCIPHQTPPQGC